MPEMSTNDAVALLEGQGYRVTPPGPKPRPRRCSVCGAVEEDVVWNPDRYDLEGIDIDDLVSTMYLVRIKVEVGDQGEEGWDYAVRYFCEEHDAERVEELMDLGYTTHHHGSTHPLADDKNCRYGCEYQGSPYHEDDE